MQIGWTIVSIKLCFSTKISMQISFHDNVDVDNDDYEKGF